MLLKKTIDKMRYLFIKNVLRAKKSFSNKIIYYLKNEDIFFNSFNKNQKITIEYDSVMELVKICEKIEELYIRNDTNLLPKIPEDKDIYTLSLFYTFEGAYIENIKEVNNILLRKILRVYEIDDEFNKKEYKFFSKSIQPHIIILEKYLDILFKTV